MKKGQFLPILFCFLLIICFESLFISGVLAPLKHGYYLGCYWNNCEDSGDWTYSETYSTLSLETSTYKEGSGSLKILRIQDYSPEVRVYLNDVFAISGCPYYSCWFRLDQYAWEQQSHILFYKNDNNYFGLRTDSGSSVRYEFVVMENGNFHYDAQLEELSWGTWYWFQVKRGGNGNYYQFMLNSTGYSFYREFGNTYSEVIPDDFAVWTFDNEGDGDHPLIYVDYVRQYSIFEYPPPSFAYGWSPDVLSVSSNYNGREINAPFSMVNRTYTSELCYVDGASLSTNEISKNGSSPYLDAIDGTTNCIYTTSTDTLWDQYYTFENTNISTVTWTRVWIRIQQPIGATVYAYAQVYLWDGSSYVGIAGFQRIGSWANMSYNIYDKGFTTQSKINNARLKIGLDVSHPEGYGAYVTAVWLQVFGYKITDSIDYEAPEEFEYTEETTVTLVAESSFESYIFNHWLVDSTEYESEIINVTISEGNVNAVIYYDSEAYLISDWVKTRFPFFFGLAGYIMMALGTIMTVKELKFDHDPQRALIWLLIIVPIGWALIVMWLFA